jgi:hypothetical protein
MITKALKGNKVLSEARHRISRREIQPKNKNQQPQAAYLQRKTAVSLQTLSSLKKNEKK